MTVSLSERVNGKLTSYGAFAQQRRDARKRGIAFHFSFEDWVKWWEDNLGPDWFKLRGHRVGQYVMARLGDVGSYHPTNVKCITSGENHREGNIGKIRPRSPEHCLAISLAKKGKPSSFKGKKHTAEAKKRLSIAQSAFQQRKRACQSV